MYSINILTKIKTLISVKNEFLQLFCKNICKYYKSIPYYICSILNIFVFIYKCNFTNFTANRFSRSSAYFYS